MSKPVTELYEAAEEAAGALDSEAEDDLSRHGTGEALLKRIGALDMVAAGSVGTSALLQVLDLVATLPPERLGLVRWVVGLDPLVLRSMRQWLNGMRAIAMGPWAEGCRAAADGLESALSGGEGPAKCPECHGAGKVKRLEGGGSIRVVKYDPCPKCAEGEGGAKEEAKPTTLPAGKPPTHTSACVDGCACRAADATGKPDCQTCPWGFPMYDEQWRALPGRVWCRHQYEYDRALGLAAKAQQPEKRILPAGKPPPFLRVGMVLMHPEAHRALTLVVLDEPVAYVRGMGLVGWVQTKVLLTLPLAEDFAVEGES